jgi:copper(I)-binding protein
MNAILRAACAALAAAAALQAAAADLCVDGLCVVRAQVAPTHGLMTRYQPLFLVVENRTGKPAAVARFATDAAEEVRVLHGDEWEPPAARALVIAPNEYRRFEGSTPWRILMVGLRQPLEPGDVVYLRMTMRSRKELVIPVRVLDR